MPGTDGCSLQSCKSLIGQMQTPCESSYLEQTSHC
uniref:Uncharacterized protein n=1 Tax=Anguilla anguilla TaxID=7936 RepID=A0A0E9Q5M6_ANGAN